MTGRRDLAVWGCVFGVKKGCESWPVWFRTNPYINSIEERVRWVGWVVEGWEALQTGIELWGVEGVCLGGSVRVFERLEG